MHYVFSKSVVGYSHIKNKKPCEDFSSSYQDNERIIITCSDGHGGRQYIRSQIGSKLAGEAVLNVFKNIDKNLIFKAKSEDLQEKIKLLVLCEYNKLVEREIATKPIRKKEIKGLSEEEIDTLRFNPAKAYGTTLSGAMLYKNKYIVVSIGDTEALGMKGGELIKLFDNSNDPAGNVTYSMCQEDAYKYLRVIVLDEKELDAVFLCTDGMSSPYRNYENFTSSFLKPTMKKVLTTKTITHVDEYVKEVATSLGVGDDVSLSFIINDKTNFRKYR